MSPDNSADNIEEVLRACKKKVESAGAIVGGIVGDNHAGVQLAIQRY